MGLTGIISELSNLLSNQPSSATGTSEDNTTPTVLADSSIQSMVQMFKLVSDGTRLRILFLLGKEKEINVRTLCGLLQQSQPAVSHHLALLRVAGVIEARRDGKHNFYSVRKEHFHTIMGQLFTSMTDESNDDIRFSDFVLRHETEEDQD